MRAEGTTFRPRCISDPVETGDLGGMERTMDDPHKDKDCFGHQGAIRITYAACLDRSF